MKYFAASSLPRWHRPGAEHAGPNSEINCPGRRVQSTRAIAPLRIRMLAGRGEQMSEPRNSGRLGLWPTTKTFSFAESGAIKAWKLAMVPEGDMASVI